MVSVWDEYLSLRQALTDIGVEEAELEARELVAFALHGQAKHARDWRELPLDAETREQLHALFARRKQDEPLAYILGEWDFYGNRFVVTPDVLIPRGDTEWLCDAAVQAAQRQKQPKILDLCCGSGCIGLSIALAVPQAQVTLVDCSEQALAVARRNAALHGLSQPRVTITAGDALRPDSIHDIFTIIVSNPPYITAQEMTALDRSVDAYEPHLALYGGADGLDFYRAMAQRPAFSLASGGLLFAECGWKQGEQAAQLFRQAGWKNVHLREDLAGIPRIICAEKF